MYKMDVMKRRTISENVTYNIIDLITKNGLEPGTKLPSEREFAEIFKVGRPAVREALRALSILNIVEIRQHIGIFVAPFDSQKIIAPFKLYMDVGKFNLEQLFELRLILEVESIGLAATKISDEQISNIEDIVSTAETGNAFSFAQTDVKLHAAIHGATGNGLLELFMSIINDLTSVSREITGSYDEVRNIVHKDHLEIVDALKDRDVIRCRESMRQHIMHVEKIIEINNKIYHMEFMKLLNHELNI